MQNKSETITKPSSQPSKKHELSK